MDVDSIHKNRKEFVTNVVLGRVNDCDDSEKIDIFYDKLIYVICGLHKNQAMAVCYKHGLVGDGVKHTHNEVGDLLGVTGARARQIVEKSIRILRHPTNLNRLVKLDRE